MNSERKLARIAGSLYLVWLSSAGSRSSALRSRHWRRKEKE
jgi:hypothetical protein